MATLDRSDVIALRTAVQLLDHPGLMARLANVVGAPIEKGLSMLPADWRQKIGRVTNVALMRAMGIAVTSLRRDHDDIETSNWWHKAIVTVSGATSGAFGLAALAVELPLSTTMMLRSIARIAQDEGHDIEEAAIRLECVGVLAFGAEEEGTTDAAENGYWAVRTAMARAISEAAAFVAQKGVVEEGAPPIVRFIATVASRFGVVVSEEAAAKAVPILGAVGGAAINYMFIDHFQNMARGHFTVRRLEQKYGESTIRREYARLRLAAA